MSVSTLPCLSFFYFNDTPTTEIYTYLHTLSLHDALPSFIGTRSAVFAPVRDLGIVVVDEEHESSYRQQESPYYNGRNTAVMRALKERSEEHTSELQSLMRSSYAVFCLKKKKKHKLQTNDLTSLIHKNNETQINLIL